MRSRLPARHDDKPGKVQALHGSGELRKRAHVQYSIEFLLLGVRQRLLAIHESSHGLHFVHRSRQLYERAHMHDCSELHLHVVYGWPLPVGLRHVVSGLYRGSELHECAHMLGRGQFGLLELRRGILPEA